MTSTKEIVIGTRGDSVINANYACNPTRQRIVSITQQVLHKFPPMHHQWFRIPVKPRAPKAQAKAATAAVAKVKVKQKAGALHATSIGLAKGTSGAEAKVKA